MKFDSKLINGTIEKRYKRFLADITLKEDSKLNKKGEVVVAHTANTGSMKSCWEQGWPVMVSFHDNPNRKLKYSLEMTHNGDTWIGVNTGVPNKLAQEAILDGTIKELQGYENLKPEAKIGKSRIDVLLHDGPVKGEGRKCYVEVKNVTMKADDGMVIFPDGVSERGQKHLRELIDLKKQGIRSCMLFIVQREDVKVFRPAQEIDPTYAELLKEAHDTGVEILVYQCSLSEKEIKVKKSIKFEL